MGKVHFNLVNLLHRFKPEAFLALSFILMILIGTVLLSLPGANNGNLTFLDILFTSTSAICVTGLTVVNTGTDFTIYGQAVILMLIQLGGIGVMSFAALAFRMLGVRLSIRAQEAASISMLQADFASEFKYLLIHIVKLILIVESFGVVFLFFGLLSHSDPHHALWSAIFHSVSAFCNAGFSLYSDSLIRFRTNPMIILTIALLIIMGGIGHPVIDDVSKLFRGKKDNKDSMHRLSLHSRVVITISAGLIFIGAVFLFAFGFNSEVGIIQKISAALFQSITARTAGFNTVEIGSLPNVSALILMVLMFIGGSPGSCAGGIKTTTFFLWIGQMWSRLHEGYGTTVFGRYIPQEIIKRASTIIGISIWWNIAGLFILLATQPLSNGLKFEHILFEQISAYGTVGLSTGITSTLNTIGKLWIIATMYIGRIGPLTIIVLMFSKKPRIKYPEGRIMVG